MQVLRLVGSELEVPVSRAELKSVSVVGADMVLTKQDGSIILLKGLALEAVVGDGATRVVFKDGAVPAQSLLGEVGEVTLDRSIAARKTIVSNDVESDNRPVTPNQNPSPQPEAVKISKSTAVQMPDADSTRPATGEAPAVPPPPPPPTPILEARKAPPPTPAVPPAMAAPDAVPFIETPPELSIRLLNIAGQSSSEVDGVTNIFGTGGTPVSALVSTPEAQAAPESILGTEGDDRIVADDPALMGGGFAKVMEIQSEARANAKLASIRITGMPDGFEIVGGTQDGDAWEVEVTEGNKIGDTGVRLVVRYPVDPDREHFQSKEFRMQVEATLERSTGGVLVGKDEFSAILRDVKTAEDASYEDADGNPGLVFPAFGLANDISAGDGADWILGNAADDTIRGGAGDDTLEGAAGADTLEGGSGIDVAD